MPTLPDLRRLAITHSLATLTTLPKALTRLGFVQADPIRAPARAQDLTLRHRVAGYRAGDLEAKYARLSVEEDFFINYGFVTRELYALMHPRTVSSSRDKLVKQHGADVLAFVRERGMVHPREVGAAFAHGRTRNAWGGQSNTTTHLLDGLHYRGLLRVTGRDNGIRLYALPHSDVAGGGEQAAELALEALIDTLLAKYAPLPLKSLQPLLGRLRFAVPQWRPQLSAAIKRSKARWPHAVIGGVAWYWPEGARFSKEVDDEVRLLTPFDPIVWDRQRFELLWGWPYRFEAYTPAHKRKWGYYALPMLWRDHVIGWANVSYEGRLNVACGYVAGSAPRSRQFQRALDDELQRLESFLQPRVR